MSNLFISMDEHERLMRDAEQRGYNEGRGYPPPGACPICAKVHRWCEEETKPRTRQGDIYQAGYISCAETILSMMNDEEASK